MGGGEGKGGRVSSRASPGIFLLDNKAVGDGERGSGGRVIANARRTFPATGSAMAAFTRTARRAVDLRAFTSHRRSVLAGTAPESAVAEAAGIVSVRARGRRG